MSVTGELAASVQLCFVLFEASSQAELNTRDVALIGEVAAVLQPVLVRMQKTLVQSKALAEDSQLLPAVSAVHSSLVGLHEAALATKIKHWLMRLLLARDVRHQLAAALKAAAAALRDLAAAAEHLLDALHLRQLSPFIDQLSAHRVTKHDHLESLGRGLFKHMLDERTDTQQLPAMLKFAVKEAAKHCSTAKASGSDGSSSSSASSSSSGSRSQLGPGERSLTDDDLMVAIQQLAEQKHGSEQLVLFQIVTVLEGLREAKCREHHRRQRQQQQHHLQRVSEAGDGADDFSISAVQAGHDSHTSSQDDQAAVSANGDPDQHSFDTALSQTMMQFEQMLLTDPHDTVALTQLLEMLLQVEAAAASESESSSDDERNHNGSHAAGRVNSISSSFTAQSAGTATVNGTDNTNARASFEIQQEHPPPSGNRGSKLSGLRSAARAALFFKGSSSNSSNGRASGSTTSRHQKRLDAAAVAGAAEAAEKAAQQERLQLVQQHKQAWQQRVHNLATAVLDVLLHLTPQPADMDTFFAAAAAGSTSGGGGGSSSSSTSGSCVIPASRDGVCTEAGHSLASSLMSHPDSILALSGCLWAWPDVAIKAARLLSILLQSGPALGAAEMLNNGSSSSSISIDAEVFVDFCRMLNGSDENSSGSSGKLWGGLVHLLYSSDALAAGVAAEAVAGIASSKALTQLCSGPAAIQIKDQLILLVTQVEQHPGTAGAAAQALHALSDLLLRPAMHKVVVASFWDPLGPEISATAEARVRTVCSSIVKVVQCSDVLASTRAASLLVMVVREVGWTDKSAEWAQCFKAGCSLLAAGIGSSSSSNGSDRLRANRPHTAAAADSRARAHGAALLAVLIGCDDGDTKPSPMLAARLEPAAQNELLLQGLDLNIQQFATSSSWHDLQRRQFCIEATSSRRPSCMTEAAAAVQLLCCLLLWLPADVCVMPELHQVVLPVVEHLGATESGLVQQLALQAQQQLVA